MDDAEKAARDASKLDPKGQMPRIDQVLGVILAQKNDIKGAKESFANYLKKDPESPDAKQVRLQLAKLDEVRAEAPAPVAAPQRSAAPIAPSTA